MDSLRDVTDEEGSTDAAYLLRNLLPPEFDDGGAAFEALTKSRDAVRIIAAQVAFLAACAVQVGSPSTHNDN